MLAVPYLCSWAKVVFEQPGAFAKLSQSLCCAPCRMHSNDALKQSCAAELLEA